jgi:malate synthase
MELLRKQLLSPTYVQHSARVLFVVGQAPAAERGPILEAIFDLPRAEVAKRVKAGQMPGAALAAHDYSLDVFEK